MAGSSALFLIYSQSTQKRTTDMRMHIAIPIAALAALPILASASFAQRTDPDPNVRLEMSRDNYRFKQQGAGNTPRLFAGSGITQGDDVFDCTGKYLGSDPDPAVRVRILNTNAPDACK
jgi:hypothetical protein